jgi:hypothetical protein
VGLLASSSWRGRSINCVRLIDFLEIEHLKHGGNDNGSLLAPYLQLVAFGLTRRLIANAIREGESRGLLHVERGGKRGTTMTELSRYRLTFLWSKTLNPEGYWEWHEPTNEWKLFGHEAIGISSGPSQAPQGKPEPAPLRPPRASKLLKLQKRSLPHKGNPLLYLGEGSPHSHAERAAAHTTQAAARGQADQKRTPPFQ